MATPPVKEAQAPFASLAHALAIFFPYLGPIVVLLFFSRSTYVRFHAIWALMGQVFYTLWLALFIIVNLSYSIYNLVQVSGRGFTVEDLIPILVKSVAVYLLFGLFGLINTVANCIQAVQAFGGNYWGGRGLTARISRKMANVQPYLPA